MKEKIKSVFLILFIVILAAAAIGGGYYILKVKPMRQAEEAYLETAETYENVYAAYEKAVNAYNAKAAKCEEAGQKLRAETDALAELIHSDDPYSEILLKDAESEILAMEKKLGKLPVKETLIEKEDLPEVGETPEDIQVSIQLIADETDRIRRETETVKELTEEMEIPDFTKEIASLQELGAKIRDSICDPFENLILSFAGTEPDGTVTLDKKSNTGIHSTYEFSVDVSTKLCNGDEITITVKPGQNLTPEELNEACIRDYGKALSSFEKRYKVEGLSYYIAGPAEIREDTFAKMQQKAEESLRFYADVNWKDVVDIESMDYLGNYFLERKATQQGYFQDSAKNQLVLLYRVKCKIDLSSKNKDYQKDVEYIYTITYKNLVNLADGTFASDLSGFSEPEESFRIDTGIWSGFLTKYRFTFKGYEDIDSAFAKIVAAQDDHYTYKIDMMDESA